MAKEQKRKEQEKKTVAIKVRKFITCIFAAGLIFTLGFKTWKWISAPTPQVAGDAIEVKENDWVKGDKDAKVTLVEYGDFQCPACASYYFITKKILEEVPTGFKTVFRHYPLITLHKKAFAASMASEAAGTQGKFWEMQN